MPENEPTGKKKRRSGPPPPMFYANLADRFLLAHTYNKHPTVRFWQDQFWVWTRARPKYVPHNQKWMVSNVLAWLMEDGIDSNYDTAVKVTHCIGAKTLLPETMLAPCWLEETSRPNDYLCMKNGLVSPGQIARRINAGEDPPKPLAPTPTWFSPVYVPYKYDPGAVNKRWLEWTKRRIKDPELIEMIAEWFGYCATPDTSRHTCVFLYGPGGTGKSTIERMLKQMVGEDNCSNLDLSEWGKTFALESTRGKLVNLSDEVANLTSEAEKNLKIFIGGNPISVDRKFLTRVDLVPSARLTVAVNVWPKFRDTSGAVFRRILVVPMNDIIDRDHQDPNVEVLMHANMSGVFNWAMNGLARLLRQGKFTNARSGQDELDRVRSETQNHVTFFQERVAESPGSFASSSDLRVKYHGWCKAQKREPVSDTELFSALQRTFPKCSRKQQRTGGRKVWGYRGIALSS